MNNGSALLLGCVADDFTGAGDAASFLANNGMRAILFSGLPMENTKIKNCDAVVIALKTRSADPQTAVNGCKDAFWWLRQHGAEHLYMKYCSTFDSTSKGNIGPVLDVLVEELSVPYTLLCPSLPVNGRTVVDGHLYVNDLPLHKSHMSRHPLNPMWDSNIAALMKPQSKYPCLTLNGDILDKPAEEILAMVHGFSNGKDHFYVVPDYADDMQGEKIAETFGQLPFLSGGSGLLAPLARRYLKGKDPIQNSPPPARGAGRGIILSGSCSKATREQIRAFLNQGGRAFALNAIDLLAGNAAIEDIWRFLWDHQQEDILIYSTGAETGAVSAGAGERAAVLLEAAMAEIGKRARDAGCRRIIVAGGETSGAVTLALGYSGFWIGESIVPGVPVMIPTADQNVRLVLKSGNFGQEDFFVRALEATKR